MKRIVLIGFSCSYKSSTGRKLAQMLDLPHMDTDVVLENVQGKTIAQLLSQGEDDFRQKEYGVVQTVPTDNIVVSTGGGVVEYAKSMQLLCNNSTVIWLRTKADNVYYRLCNSNQPRPLANHMPLDKLTAFVAERDVLYAQYADIIIDTDDTSSADLADRVYKLFV